MTSVRPTSGCLFFIFPTGWYGYEIELSDMGKNNEMVCENADCVLDSL